MHAITIGDSLRGMLGIGGTRTGTGGVAPPALDEGAVLDELQAASDRLRSRLDDAPLRRTELIALADDLEPVGRVLLRLRKDHGKRDEAAHAIRLTDAALHDIYELLYLTRSWQPYVWPGALQAKLRSAQGSLAQAIVALRWARMSG